MPYFSFQLVVSEVRSAAGMTFAITSPSLTRTLSTGANSKVVGSPVVASTLVKLSFTISLVSSVLRSTNLV